MPCHEQLVELQDHRDEIAAAGGDVVAVSGDRPESLERVRESLGLGFPLVSDADLAVSRLYGVREDLRGSTVRRPETSVPAVFVVGRAGRIRYVQVARHPRDRAPLRDVLAALAEADLAWPAGGLPVRGALAPGPHGRAGNGPSGSSDPGR